MPAPRTLYAGPVSSLSRKEAAADGSCFYNKFMKYKTVPALQAAIYGIIWINESK
jgi:hypothetical protein